MPFYPYAVLQNYGISKSNFAFKTAHATYTMPKYWESYRQQYNRLSKYRKPTGTPSGNAAALRSLQRKVAGMEPELQQYKIIRPSAIFAAGAYNQVRYDITDELAALADRPERVTGDSWKNKFLKFRFHINTNAPEGGWIRFIVIKPKKAGTTFSIAEGDILDPNQMTVFYDKTFTYDRDYGQRSSSDIKVNLRNLKSTYIGSTPESGDIQMYVCCRNQDTSWTIPVTVTTQLNYTDM